MTTYQILKKYWNFSAFRSLQEDIIDSVLANRDTLALMPTGGGKSICFQVPALIKPGICIVVSPLIALIKDQVEALQGKGIKALAIISGMGKREVDIALDNCIYGQIKFLYLSPERLLSDLVRERIRYMNVNLFAIDEAHCISQWGYDFRPSYLQLTALRELHPAVPMLALTATATSDVIEDIQDKLGFKESNVLRKSFERKNLNYIVIHEENKFRRLFNIIKKVKGTGIVYVRNRRATQEISRLLNREGITSDFYHAGLSTPVRASKQDSWKTNITRVIVATNAFGMGIDKADVRFVVHFDLPESLEAYYQEAGRAGRDEKKAYAILLYSQSDKIALEKKLSLSFPSPEEIKQVYHMLGNYFQLAYGAGEGLVFEFDIGNFCSRFKLEALKTLNAFKFLEHDGYITLSESVYLPSRVKIIVNQEELYRFQIEHSNFDSFIKIILRSYGGLFDQFVPIKESELARRANQPVPVVFKMLEQLDNLKFISYIKQTDKPQIEFLQGRAESANLILNNQYIKQRREIMQKQVAAVIGYAESKKCRSRLLLSYFDDHQTENCGICDVCLEEKRALTGAVTSEQISFTIIELLSQNHLDLDELVNAILIGTEKERISILRDMLDAGKVKTDGSKYYI